MCNNCKSQCSECSGSGKQGVQGSGSSSNPEWVNPNDSDNCGTCNGHGWTP